MMKKIFIVTLFTFSLIRSFSCFALLAGTSSFDITPKEGIPSAGYEKREGKGMLGVHDPLLATTLFLDTGEKKIVFCGVDNLGLTYPIVQKIIQKVKENSSFESLEVFIGSSHTHSGRGAFLDIPYLGQILAGEHSEEITNSYIEKISASILEATQNTQEVKIGIGYAKAPNLSCIRTLTPENLASSEKMTLLKVVDLENHPVAALLNFPLHPTVLGWENFSFSADFVGYVRKHLKQQLGEETEIVYFNGAQGEVVPLFDAEKDGFEEAERIGKTLAKYSFSLWDEIELFDSIKIDTKKDSYGFIPEATSLGLKLPIDWYQTEINLIIFNNMFGFLTIPGELSCYYESLFSSEGKKLGYQEISIFGLTNDAHGYILHPEAWEEKTYESQLSFGGKLYGEKIAKKTIDLLSKSE